MAKRNVAVLPGVEIGNEDGLPAATLIGPPPDDTAYALGEGRALIKELIRLEIGAMRSTGIAVGEDEYRGLYTSDTEADRLLGLERVPGGATAAEAATVRERVARLAESDSGRFGRLVRLCGLDAFEAGCVLLCLASEVDLTIERLIAYVQDDVTKRRPRVDLALRLLSEPEAMAAARSSFEPGAPLRLHRLVTLHDEPGQPHTPLVARYVALDPRVAAFLAGQGGMDELLHPFSALVQAGEVDRAEAGALRGVVAAQVGALAALPVTALEPPVLSMFGPDVAQRRIAAQELAWASGLGLLRVQFAQLSIEAGFDLALTLATREAALQGAALVLEQVDKLSRDEAQRLRTRVRTQHLAPLIMLDGEELFAWPGVSIEVPELEFEAQRALWEETLPAGSDVSEADLSTLAGKFRLGTEEIADAMRGARGKATWRDPAHAVVNIEDLYASARTQSTPILSDLARKITPHYAWDDIVLPADARDQLREMCAHIEHRHQVYEVWGLGAKLAMGKGLMALFAGNSGTGKTMAADVMAGTLGLDLYKIDLSGVVSKYIGETEKNLATIFTEAGHSNAILFFDEADALFGKRSEVKDAHDRYANIETAYLLQRMEEYAGMVVLATNLKSNLDEAFLRRLHFVIDFPMPDEDDRRRIWKATIPSAMPMTDDVDLEFLSRQFKIAGGNIRNVVLAAAFLASSEGSSVGMRHMVRGIRREYQKLGRMVTDAEFGVYVEFIR
ncbi:MAG: ATP-binding protein [Tepidiformaceae bacterium]